MRKPDGHDIVLSDETVSTWSSESSKATFTTNGITKTMYVEKDGNAYNSDGNVVGKLVDGHITVTDSMYNALFGSGSGGTSNVTIDVRKGDHVTSVTTPDGSNVTVNNRSIINTINTGKYSSLVLDNSGTINNVNIGESASTKISNSGTIDVITAKKDSSMNITNTGYIGHILTGENSRNAISNIGNGQIDWLETGINNTSSFSGRSANKVSGNGEIVYEFDTTFEFVNKTYYNVAKVVRDSTNSENIVLIQKNGTRTVIKKDVLEQGYVITTTLPNGATAQSISDPKGNFKNKKLESKEKDNGIVLTEDEKKLGVKVVTIDGKQYYDYSELINTVFYNAAVEALEHKGDLEWFKSKVNHSADWDIKRKEPWEKTVGTPFPGSYDTKIIVNGSFTTPEELGNIMYGYTGTAADISEPVLVVGSMYAAGIWQIITDKDKRTNEFNDHAPIRKGIQWYKDKEK